MREEANLSCFNTEKSALGSLLWEDKEVLSIADSMGLKSDHFFCPIHAKAWEFLSGRFRNGDSVDIGILYGDCKKELKEIGGFQALTAWRGDCAPANFNNYARIILDRAARREATQKLAELQDSITSGENMMEIADKIRDAATVADSSLVGCRWNISEAEDYWSDDPDEIQGLADKPIIDGLLREREIVQLVGAAKSQKTWFALHLACSVARGGEFLERQCSRQRVLYVDYELKQSTFKRRLSMVAKSKPANLDILLLRGESKLPGINDLKRIIEKGAYGLVIVDSLYRTGWLTEENNNDAVSRELTGLQGITSATGASLVVVDHTAKGGGKDRSSVDSSRGASSKGGFFDGIFVLRPQEKAPDGENRVFLDCALRDWPNLPSVPVLGYSFTATSCQLKLVGEADESDLSGNRQAIWEVLNSQSDGISVADIGAIVKLSDSTTRRILREMKEDGKAETCPDPKHSQRVLWRPIIEHETPPKS